MGGRWLNDRSSAPYRPRCRPGRRRRSGLAALGAGGEGAGEGEAELLLGRLQGVLGADDAEAALRGDGVEGRGEAAEVLRRRREDLVPEPLAVLVALAQEMPQHGLVALRVREHVGVHVAHAADDGLRELVLAELDILQEARGAVVVAPRPAKVGVPVGEVLEVAAPGVELAEAPVGAAADAHAVPEVGGSQEFGDHQGGAVELVARSVEVAPLAHVVDLRGHDDALRLAAEGRLGGGGLHVGAVREARGEGLER
mmetsp:Transcript_99777/g.310805  ORF Transcript_99777/g.310805 Transcript_99777/m.310805 type:complete len:255 (-) Transcript_99777:1043-1807(-)